MGVTHNDLKIDWLGYATVRLTSPTTVVYLDPGRYGVLTGDWTPDSEAAGMAHPNSIDRQPQDGDAVFVTHRHHYDPDGIRRVVSDDGTVVTFDGIDSHAGTRDLPRVEALPGSTRQVSQETEGIVADCPFWTVPAYNDPDGSHVNAAGTPYHPEGRGCGYLISIAGQRVFWPGDTDVLPGHDQLDVDIFLPPIGGQFTMNRHEAAALAETVDPELVVPIHYNTFEAIETDSRAFAGDVAARGVPVVLDETGNH